MCQQGRATLGLIIQFISLWRVNSRFHNIYRFQVEGKNIDCDNTSYGTVDFIHALINFLRCEMTDGV